MKAGRNCGLVTMPEADGQRKEQVADLEEGLLGEGGQRRLQPGGEEPDEVDPGRLQAGEQGNGPHGIPPVSVQQAEQVGGGLRGRAGRGRR